MFKGGSIRQVIITAMVSLLTNLWCEHVKKKSEKDSKKDNEKGGKKKEYRIIIMAVVECIVLFLFLIVDIKIVSGRYKWINGHYYTVCYEHLSWSEAQLNCRSEGGNLVTIGDKAEQEKVSSLVTYESCWIGAYKNQKDEWSWVTGEPFVFSNWDDGEPNNSNGFERFVLMYPLGKWNDGTEYAYFNSAENLIDGVGYTGLPYICEWEHKINFVFCFFESYWSLGIF